MMSFGMMGVFVPIIFTLVIGIFVFTIVQGIRYLSFVRDESWG